MLRHYHFYDRSSGHDVGIGPTPSANERPQRRLLSRLLWRPSDRCRLIKPSPTNLHKSRRRYSAIRMAGRWSTRLVPSRGAAFAAARLRFRSVIFAADLREIDVRRWQLEPHIRHGIRDVLRNRVITKPLVVRRDHVPRRPLCARISDRVLVNRDVLPARACARSNRFR